MTTFEEFYSRFPRKKARADARKAWEQAMKKGFDPDEIMRGLQINLPSMLTKDPQFVKYPASWLRGECWADEPDTGFRPAPIARPDDMTNFMMSRRESRHANTIDAEYAANGNRGQAYRTLEDASPSRRH